MIILGTTGCKSRVILLIQLIKYSQIHELYVLTTNINPIEVIFVSEYFGMAIR